MAEKSAKKKRKKADQPGVLGSLPSTRPARIGRDRPASENGGGTAMATATKPRATNARPKPKPKKAAAKPRPVTPPPPEPDGRRATPPRGIELVTTGAQAAGEVARIGLTVGGQVLKRAARRLPRP